jgi:putative DNA primase/helicase
MAGPALDRVQAKLTGWKAISGGKWLARCPAHDDQHQSLHVSERHDLSVGLHCHAGCVTADVVNAMGLTFADLFSNTTHDGKEIAATYDYRDSTGQLLYQAVRYWPKAFKHRRPDGAGDWIWDMVPFKGKHVPYRLPDLKGHNDVCIVEGEKDADRLWSIGIPATTNIGGAKNWTANDTKCLKQAGCTRAFLIPDNDAAGHARVEMVAKSVKAAAIAVSVIELEVGPSGDVSDWLSNGGTKEDLLSRMAGTLYVMPADHVHEPVVVPAPLPDALLDPLKYKIGPTVGAGAAEAFRDRYKDRLRYDHTRECWYVWDQHRWKRDVDEEVMRLALQHSRRWGQEVTAAAPDFGARKKWEDYTLKLERRPDRVAMLSDARIMEPFKGSPRWDTNPWLLGVPNGVLNLKTGELRAGDPTDLITMHTGVQYDADALCPRWLQFLDEVFENDEIVAFMRQFCGYCLTGRTSEQIVVFCYGKGHNGKGRLLHALKNVMGEYSAVLPFSSLIASRKGAEQPSNDLAALYGKRFVTASEINEGQRLNEARIKGLTGEDSITARFLYEEYVTFDPMAKYILAVNHKPVVRDDSDGFWRRVRLIPFNKQFKGAANDQNLDDKLKLEWPGILAWAVQGCLEWQQHGLSKPDVIVKATKEYEQESDPLVDFLAEYCEVHPNATVGAHALYKSYLEWADKSHLSKDERLGSNPFGQAMSRKFTRERISSGNVYFGVRVATGLPLDSPPDPADGDLI